MQNQLLKEQHILIILVKNRKLFYFINASTKSVLFYFIGTEQLQQTFQ